MKKFLLFIFTFLFSITVVNAETTKKEVTFVRCVDGDTAVFNVDGTETKFRFLAIDTPETVHPTKEVEAYGKDASEYTCNRITNATSIIVEYEESNKVDKYGRSLGWIWVDGLLLQEELVSVGYAEVAYIYGTYKYTESLCVAQADAITNNYGIWADGREQGYCATLDLTDKKNTIYTEDDTDDTLDNSTVEEDIIDAEEIANKLEDANDALSKIDDADYSNVLFYVMVGGAILYLLRETAKNKK